MVLPLSGLGSNGSSSSPVCSASKHWSAMKRCSQQIVIGLLDQRTAARALAGVRADPAEDGGERQILAQLAHAGRVVAVGDGVEELGDLDVRSGSRCGRAACRTSCGRTAAARGTGGASCAPSRCRCAQPCPQRRPSSSSVPACVPLSPRPGRPCRRPAPGSRGSLHSVGMWMPRRWPASRMVSPGSQATSRPSMVSVTRGATCARAAGAALGSVGAAGSAVVRVGRRASPRPLRPARPARRPI